MDVKVIKPEIRFDGFTDDWEQRKFGDAVETVTDFVAAGSFADLRENVAYQDTPDYAQLVRTVDLKNGFTSSSPVYVNEHAFEFLYRVNLNIESIILPNIGNCGEVYFIRPEALPYSHNVLGPNAIMVRSDSADNQFLSILFQGTDFQKKLKLIISPNGQTKFNKTELKQIVLVLPVSKDEQMKLGELFAKLDELINLHQRKHDKLVLIKRSMLEKMFPREYSIYPEIRFDGFIDPWKQRKLSSIYRNIRNAFVGIATPYYVSEGHFYLESNNVKNGQINRNSEVFINDDFYYQQKDKWLRTNDMVMVQSGHVGHAAVIPENLDKTAAHALIMFTDQIEETEPYFLNYQYQTEKSYKKISDITKGNTIKHILSSDMQKYIVDVPSLAEQKEIASFFQKLDDLIALYQRKLLKLKVIKSALLQNMFVS